MKTYHKDFSSGAVATITDHRDGTAHLKVTAVTRCGKVTIHNKDHKTRKAALAAWYRMTN